MATIIERDPSVKLSVIQRSHIADYLRHVPDGTWLGREAHNIHTALLTTGPRDQRITRKPAWPLLAPTGALRCPSVLVRRDEAGAQDGRDGDKDVPKALNYLGGMERSS